MPTRTGCSIAAPSRTLPRNSRTSTAIIPTRRRRGAPSSWRPTPTTRPASIPKSIAAAQRYTTLHPGTKDAALAHHIIASANFDEIRDPGRDQTATRKALAELKTLRQRYPDSPYTKQAENRIRIAEDLLAASEMSVGRYYQNKNNLVAAMNRYKVVVSEYQTTAQVEEALYRLVETNMALGMAPDAQSAAAVLGHNYPNSQWYKHAHALLKSGGLSPQVNQGTWISKTLKALMPGGQQPKPQPAAPVPAQPSPGLPNPDDMPAPRVPSDVPTASTAAAAHGLRPEQRVAGRRQPIGSGFRLAAEAVSGP